MGGNRDLKKYVRLGEQGMISILGLSALGILLFLSGTIYTVGLSHTRTAGRFLAGCALRNAAEDGVRLGLAKLNAETGTAARAEGAASRHVSLFTGASGDATIQVYARRKEGRILLLSVSQRGEERARAIGVAKKTGGKYVIDHWER